MLTAVDSALMVIDGAKGVEARTEKLIEICRMRDTPVITFVNKLDREGLPPLELLDEIEEKLGIPCVPWTWPIGMGKRFKGVYHIIENRRRYFIFSAILIALGLIAMIVSLSLTGAPFRVGVDFRSGTRFEVQFAEPVEENDIRAVFGQFGLTSPSVIALRGEGLARSFGETQALRNAAIELRAGEVHAVVGENGSGKSTLVKILSGVLPPDRGTLTMDGRQLARISSPAVARRLGIAPVFQISYEDCPGRSGFECTTGTGPSDSTTAFPLLSCPVTTRLIGSAMTLLLSSPHCGGHPSSLILHPSSFIL